LITEFTKYVELSKLDIKKYMACLYSIIRADHGLICLMVTFNQGLRASSLPISTKVHMMQSV